MVRRIFAEKKKGFDIEAQGLYHDLKQDLKLENLEGVRIINRYDIQGVGDAMYEIARETVFSEPAIDCVYDETLPVDMPPTWFATEYLPGQYDQRADSAMQCIKLMDFNEKPIVRFARVIALEGSLSPAEVDAVKAYCINPVDSCEASREKPESIEIVFASPEDVAVVTGFIDYDAAELEAFRKEMGFAMSRADILLIAEYFKEEEKRDPTVTELRVLDTYWSDHCRHTTFQTALDDVYFEGGAYADVIKEAFDAYLAMRREVYGERVQSKNVCLMDIACIGAKYLKKQGLCDDLDESEEINACSINVRAKIDGKEEDWLVMFKNETHNHPTEIEPFGGAATCLGGAIRDPLSGRVYVYQAMRVTGAADPTDKVNFNLPGKLSQKKITRGAAAGYSSYGNQIGLATGQVDEIYDPGYVAKRMEIGAVIGAAPKSHVRRERPQEGDAIILLGGRTGRDGCGGATGSSKEHTEESILTCGAEVQKGNPPVERNIQRMFRRKEVAVMIKRCNDFGAGGVSVAIGELADSLDVNLDLVPKKYEGLDGTELAISESQERMAVVVDAADADKFIALANEENLEATAVAKVTDTGRFRMFWRGTCILDLSRRFIDTNGARQSAAVAIKNKDFGDVSASLEFYDKGLSLEENMNRVLTDLNCCGKKGLIERFDSSIGAGSVLAPLGGKYQLTPAAGMAAKLPVTQGDTETATLMAYGFDPAVANASTYHSALYAVVHSATKIAAMGGDIDKIRLTFQEYFEKMTQDPGTWAKPFAALLGALEAQKALGIPAIGGKDSMSGTFMDINVPPTLVSFAVCVTDVGTVVSQEFKKTDSTLVRFTVSRAENGIIDFASYKKNMAKVTELAASGKLLAADAIGKGGLFLTAFKMAAGNKIGAEIGTLCSPCMFRADYGAILAEIDAAEDIETLLAGAEYKVVGRTTTDAVLKVDTGAERAEISLDAAIAMNGAPLEEIFPVRPTDCGDAPVVSAFSYAERSAHKPAVKIARPAVVIPTFPGTNCEMDSKRAFDAAGARADILLIRNRNAQTLNESIRAFEQKIRESQIIMIPGGFSGGDEPDGSAKFITAVFRNPRIKDAVTDLLENRDGLILGVCNGFQALIKLGLVPYGKIIDIDAHCPTLTYNTIGRHVARFVNTRIASVKSPWLANTTVGDIHTIAVSHGEGRFIATDDVAAMLIANGQIATQYTDYNGNPAPDIDVNPNGSLLAIEGITSPDGRVFGKMAHSERVSAGTYKNIHGNKEQGLFAAGVKYFE